MMSRTFVAAMLAAACVVALGLPASAQFGIQGPGGFSAGDTSRATTVKGSKSNTSERATSVKSSKSNTSDRMGGGGGGGSTKRATTVKSSKSNTSDRMGGKGSGGAAATDPLKGLNWSKSKD
jgi:hypothetical protein